MKVVSIAGDGGTYDIGLQSLSGMLERGDKVTHICISNECYSNTGIQRSGATPLGAWTTTTPTGKKISGKQQPAKNIMEIVAAHRVPYAATASVAYPEDMQAKFKKAIENQPSFLLIQTPCPPAWKMDTSASVKAAKLAVQTGMWALYEVENGRLKFTVKPQKRLHVKDYLEMQGRFRHLTPGQVTEMQKQADAEFAMLEKIERSGVLF
jgi:pyruvate/2-oxoacid:ferredoxin oxidoreductase beta subunit